MKKLIILLFTITITYADNCENYVNNFKESIDDIKIAIELNSKNEAEFFFEEAYNSILDLSAACTGKSMKKNSDIKKLRETLNQYKDILN